MRADVVVPAFRDTRLTLECLRSVLAHSDEALGRLFVVDDCSPEPDLAAALEQLRREDERVRILTTPSNLGFVGAVNLGLAASEFDCVILNSDTRVTPGWLTELLGALAEHPRHAALSPLSNNATSCSVPDFGLGVDLGLLDGRALDLSGLPRVTDLPTGHGFCMLLRRAALRDLGLFDRKYGRGYNEENDWCQRARAQGLLIGRANRALVLHHGNTSFGYQARSRLDVVNARRLIARYPSYLEDNRRFEAGPYARMAARAVRAQLGLLRVQAPPAQALNLGLWGRVPRPGEVPDVACVTETVAVPGRFVVITVLGEDTLVDEAQLRWSQGVVAPQQRHAALLALGATRVRAPDALPQLVTEITLHPDLTALELQAQFEARTFFNSQLPTDLLNACAPGSRVLK